MAKLPLLSVGKWWPGRWPGGQSRRDQARRRAPGKGIPFSDNGGNAPAAVLYGVGLVVTLAGKTEWHIEAMAKQIYDLEWCKAYAAKHGGQCLSSEYRGIHNSLSYRCADGHVWETRPANHVYKKSWCPECLSGKEISEEDARAIVETAGYELLAYPGGAHAQMTVKCATGHEWQVTLNNFKHTKHGCPECSGVANEYVRAKARKYTIGDIRQLAAQHAGSCLTLQNEAATVKVSCADRGQFECADGHTWETPFGTITRGHWCPQCAHGAKRPGRNASR